jgi:hypothetical protein
MSIVDALPPARVLLALCALMGAVGSGQACSATRALPDYLVFQLQARSSPTGNFNLPSGASINSATVDLSDAGLVSIRVALPTGIPGDDFTRHVFVGSNGAGFVVSEGPVGSLVSDPRTSPDGKVWYAVNFAGGNAQAGIYRYNPADLSTVRITGLPLGTSSYEAPRANAAGQIGYRASFASGRAWVSFSAGSVAVHAAEQSIDAGSPYGFLFTPSFDENRVIVGKVLLVANAYNQIRSIDDRAATQILVRSNAENGSPYFAFDNSPALSPNSRRVAFIANLGSGANPVRGVFRYDPPGSIVEIARTGTQGLSAIEFFGPAINDDGLVAFRGVDSNGLQAIFVGDDSTLRRVIGRGDTITTDLGLGQIDQETPASPAFSGGVSINDNGDIAFSPTLTPAGNNQIEWGTGVYIARAGTQLLHADGFEGN